MIYRKGVREGGERMRRRMEGGKKTELEGKEGRMDGGKVDRWRYKHVNWCYIVGQVWATGVAGRGGLRRGGCGQGGGCDTTMRGREGQGKMKHCESVEKRDR